MLLRKIMKNSISSVLIISMIMALTACSDSSLSVVETKPTDGIAEKDGNIVYYQNGQIVTGMTTIDGSTYHFDETTGNMTKGWFEQDGKQYYFDENGKMLKGTCTVDDVEYNFADDTGILFTGWQTVGEDKFYYYEDETANHKRGQMALGVQEIDGNTYYFYDVKTENAKRPRGSVLKNNRIVAHKTLYCFDADGVCYRQVDGTKKLVALTFDDGPSKYTKTILDVLEENHAVATFFVIGNRVEDNKEYLIREIQMGNQVGNHTWDHKFLNTMSASGVREEVGKADEVITSIINKTPTIMRPPGGRRNEIVFDNVGKPIILWAVDSRDWESKNSEKIQKLVFKLVKDGDTVLMHDIYEPSANAAKVIIPELINQGYQLVTVEELALLRGKHLENGKVYRSFPPEENKQ